MARGRFITLEGGEGTGKSTQIARLAEALGRAGIDCITTREPGGAPGAEEIRKLLVEGHVERWDGFTEVLLHYAARHEHLLNTVVPAIEAGRWVICDRFADSTLAYQGYGHGVDRAAIARLHELVVGDVAPDLTLVFDLATSVGLDRANSRGDGEDRYERMGDAFHDRLRQGFLEIARDNPERCVVVDAGRDMDGVSAQVFSAVSERLGVDLS